MRRQPAWKNRNVAIVVSHISQKTSDVGHPVSVAGGKASLRGGDQVVDLGSVFFHCAHADAGHG
jgi:hypothetical protein